MKGSLRQYHKDHGGGGGEPTQSFGAWWSVEEKEQPLTSVQCGSMYQGDYNEHPWKRQGPLPYYLHTCKSQHGFLFLFCLLFDNPKE